MAVSVCPPSSWWLRLGGAVLLLLLLGACSSTTFIYNRLDFLIPWYLDDYVDITRDQRRSVDESLQPFLRWHRADELPQYIALLERIENKLDTGVTPEAVGEFLSGAEQAWLRLEAEALGWIFKLGEELTNDQIEEFLGVLEKEQTEYEEEYLERSQEEYREDSFDNLVDSLQDYMGRLDKTQKTILREASAKFVRMDALWLQERANWLVILAEVLQREPGWQQGLRDAMAARDASHTEQYNENYRHNLDIVKSAIADTLNGRSDKQDRRLRKKIKNLREDLQTLSAQAG